MRLGICCAPKSAEGSSLVERALKMQDVLRTAGADYFEMGVASVMADDFDELKRALRPLELRPEAFNSFIPGHFRLTGDEASHEAALEYCRQALGRCASIGGEVVVLGSAGARKVPEGFSREKAREQFIEFCSKLGPIAQDAGITIAIEPLNGREDNLILSVSEGARIADEVAHPSIQLLADLYHMVLEGGSVESVASAGSRLKHTHVASSNRRPPGVDTSDSAPYAGFFEACRRAGYDARCSYEGSISDFASDSRTLIAHLRAQIGA